MGLFYSVEDRNTPDWEVLGAPLDVYGRLQFRHPRGVVPRYLLVSYFPLFSKNKKKMGKHLLEDKWGGKQNLAPLLCGEKVIPVQAAFSEETT